MKIAIIGTGNVGGALAWINLAVFQGMGRDIGFKLLSR